MSPPFRKKTNLEYAYKNEAKESAVLILLYEKAGETYLVLTERKVYKGAHSGQISLPGGKKENYDNHFEATALRETEEEIGVKKSIIEILCRLTHLYIPVSNFIVFPFVGVLNGIPNFIKEDAEVENILEVKLKDLLDEKKCSEITIDLKTKNIKFQTPAYLVNGVEVWGATAMILSEFLYLLKN